MEEFIYIESVWLQRSVYSSAALGRDHGERFGTALGRDNGWRFRRESYFGILASLTSKLQGC